MREVGHASGERYWDGGRKSTATRSQEGRAGVLAAQDRALKKYATPSRPVRAAHLRLPPSSSAGAVTPTGGGLPVVKFALRRRRRKLRDARFPPGVGGSRKPQRPRRGGASPLAGSGGGGNDGVLPPARRWGAAAPLQEFRSSAAAPPDQARPSRRSSWPRGAGRRPLLSTPWSGDVGLPHLGHSRRRLQMPLALTSAPRRCLPPRAAETPAAARSSAGFRSFCCARQCSVGGLRRATRTPQSQMRGM